MTADPACSRCQQPTALWAHRAGHSRHEWEGGQGACGCAPLSLCLSCDVELLREHGFLMLDEEAFPDVPLLN